MPIRVLFLCTANSARSIMAEALLARAGADDFDVSSAGTRPGGIHPLTARVLEEHGFANSQLHSKSIDAVVNEDHGRNSQSQSRDFDYVITLCDRAALECPTFAGRAERLHWSIEDPAAAAGSDDDQLAAFRRAYDDIDHRIAAFIPLARRVAARRARRRTPHRIAVLA